MRGREGVVEGPSPEEGESPIRYSTAWTISHSELGVEAGPSIQEGHHPHNKGRLSQSHLGDPLVCCFCCQIVIHRGELPSDRKHRQSDVQCCFAPLTELSDLVLELGIKGILLLFFFLGLHPRHMEVPRPGVDLELQLLATATATATQNPSHVCDLHPSSLQHQILNPLSETRD